MCGIAGFFGESAGARTADLRTMLDAIRHRGPDDEGVWAGEGACLGHRRLAIIDTSPAGRQPMQSACGRYVITLNGEIYNYRALRAALEEEAPVPWRGHSDSEVFLETVARLGVREALVRSRGMFAMGLWDRLTHTAYLARDRLGEKPVCYLAEAEGLVFASEIRCLERIPRLPPALSQAALHAFFRYGYVPAPLSIYEGARKLGPGELLTWRAGAEPSIEPYWRLDEVIQSGRSHRLNDETEAADALDRVLRQVVSRQMMSDVPLGAFLSGGIDSSLVAAVMQSVSEAPIRTFTLGFDAPEFNEAEHAAAVARHLGCDHTEHYVTGADARAVAPRLGELYDEPFADPSQIPTFLISRMAREKVTVCLTGDGGDEMFGGYVRYTGVERLWKAMGRMPGRGALAAILERAPLPLIDGTLAFLGPLARGYASRGALGPNLRRAGTWLRADSREALFEATMCQWPDTSVLLGSAAGSPCSWRPDAPGFDNSLEEMLWRDTVDYLPGDILTKVDRAAMANSLETRLPFLDADVADLAWRISPSLKVRGGLTKWIVRNVLSRYAPSALTDRPKVGFTPPLHAWLTGGLRSWALDLLDPGVLRRQGLLDATAVEGAWRAFEGGDSALGGRLWTVLMFQAWRLAHGR